ncbi:hypothetical protein ZWY2020_047522 [Hordeum vulgare]|nr:hypothetical protein ZWY2020_047522 [Hordeum vulgare]
MGSSPKSVKLSPPRQKFISFHYFLSMTELLVSALPNLCVSSYNAASHFFIRLFIRCYINWLFLPPTRKHFHCSSIIYSVC